MWWYRSLAGLVLFALMGLPIISSGHLAWTLACWRLPRRALRYYYLDPCRYIKNILLTSSFQVYCYSKHFCAFRRPCWSHRQLPESRRGNRIISAKHPSVDRLYAAEWFRQTISSVLISCAFGRLHRWKSPFRSSLHGYKVRYTKIDATMLLLIQLIF